VKRAVGADGGSKLDAINGCEEAVAPLKRSQRLGTADVGIRDTIAVSGASVDELVRGGR
jgi:hypothetical protein